MIIISALPTDNLQIKLDFINEYGGGILNLQPTANYNLTYDLNFYSNIVINGNGATIDFGGTSHGIKIIGTAMANILNPSLSYLTVQNSSGIGIDCNYVNSTNLNVFDNIIVQNCTTTGIRIQNSYAPYITGTIQNNGVNLEMDTVNSFEIHFTAFIGSTTGDGIVMNNCSSAEFIDVGIYSNHGNGIKMTNCSTLNFNGIQSSSNGGDGVRMVSGNAINKFDQSDFGSNGGYGINIEDNTTTGTIFVGISTESNTSGGLSDSGTGTLKSSTVNNFN